METAMGQTQPQTPTAAMKAIRKEIKAQEGLSAKELLAIVRGDTRA